MSDEALLGPLPPIAELGRGFRSGGPGPVEILEQCLERIAACDERLNAVITVTERLAREQAERAELELKSGIDRGAMHGIPVGIKDLIDVAGEPTTWASKAEPPHHPKRSAALARHLESAGAVCVAKTNLLEYAFGAVHPDFGQTNNPWNPERVSGGSSSGSGAGIAAGFFAAAVGTDTGGSIRAPASYCGIAGLKPTFGLVELDGVFPLSWSLDHAGPMARTPACALAMLGAMTGRDTDLEPAGLPGLRFAVVESFYRDPAVSLGVAQAFDHAVALLEAAGGRRVEPALPDLAPADQALVDIILPEATAVHERLLARNPEGYGPDTRRQLEMGYETSALAYVKANRYREGLRHDIDRTFEEVDILISPTVAWVAPGADLSVVGDEGAVEMRFMAPWNLTGHPTLSIPCGTGEDGLPVGLQLIGPAGDDDHLLRIAEAWTRRLPPLFS